MKLPRLRHTKPLLLPLAIWSAASVLCVKLYPNLGFNLLAETFALWFGIFVIEMAIEKGRAEERKPAHRAMVDDLCRLRMPIIQVLFLLLVQTCRAEDIPALKSAARGEGDVATLLARCRLTNSPAPMMQLGILSGPQLTWWQIVSSCLSPQALRLETLIARYITVADAPMLAALQGLETCWFMDALNGRILFSDGVDREIFWRSLIQSFAALDKELTPALAEHNDRGAALGPATYIALAIPFIEQGNASWAHH